MFNFIKICQKFCEKFSRKSRSSLLFLPSIFNISPFSAIGMNFVMAAFNLALNSYFVRKRGVATGIAMSLTGLGPIFMPLLVSLLISCYGVRTAGMTLAAITLHSLVGAALLQPVKWHSKKNDGKFPILYEKFHLCRCLWVLGSARTLQKIFGGCRSLKEKLQRVLIPYRKISGVLITLRRISTGADHSQNNDSGC